MRNQRTIFVASYPVQAVAAAAIAFGVLDHFLSVGALFALVAVISILWDMTWAAINAAPGVLLTPDEQFAAGGVSGAIGGALTLFGYAAGGLLLLWVGAAGGMLLYAALLGLGAVLALPLVIVPPRPKAAESFGASFRSGWELVLGGEGRPFLQLATIDSIEGFLAGGAAILITLFATATYHGAASGYATLFVAFVVGGVVAGLVLGAANPRAGVGLLMPAALAACGIAYLAAAVLPPLLALAAATWALIGFSSSAYLGAKYAFFRGSVPPDRLGRFVSNMYLFPGLASIAGAVVLSEIASGGSPRLLGAVIGALFLVGGAVGLALPRVRQMRY